MCKLLSLVSEEFYSAIVRYFARFLNIRIALVGFFDVYCIGQTWLINNKRIASCYELSKRRTISVRLVNWQRDERVWRFVELIDAAIHVSLLMQSMYELVTHTCHSLACARTHTCPWQRDNIEISIKWRPRWSVANIRSFHLLRREYRNIALYIISSCFSKVSFNLEYY